ncbi:diguanylate cyclase [Shewanella gaetbuli]
MNTNLANILIVDDDSSIIITLNKVLKTVGRIRFASDAKQAFDMVTEQKPDLILLDVNLPDISGVDICLTLKNSSETKHIPILFITSHIEDGFEEKVFDVGAADYIVKPLKPAVVAARVQTHLNYHRIIKSHDNLAHTDGLTGLANRRSFDENLKKEFKRAQRDHKSLAVVMIDIDEFKKFNDHYGHIEGDECLKSFAKLLQASTKRPGDIAARYGGEEFTFILPDTNEQGVHSFLLELLLQVKKLNITHAPNANLDSVTLSIGYTVYTPKINPHCNDEYSLVKSADDALYKAKQKGRNQICYQAMPSNNNSHCLNIKNALN